MVVVGTQNEANRVAWLEKTLKQIPSGARILDAGAGEQKFKKFCAHLDYVAQDFAQYDGKGDGKGLHRGLWDTTKIDIVSNIIAIPEPDASFDAIMCTEVFEHLPEPLKALNEFNRLLRPGGHLIITAPFCSLTHFAPYHYYTGFNRYFYETHLPIYGFKILEIEANGNFFEFIAQEIRRIPSIALRYSNTSPHKWEGFAMNVVLKMLARFSKQDRGSAEILNFGFHVCAVKK